MVMFHSLFVCLPEGKSHETAIKSHETAIKPANLLALFDPHGGFVAYQISYDIAQQLGHGALASGILVAASQALSHLNDDPKMGEPWELWYIMGLYMVIFWHYEKFRYYIEFSYYSIMIMVITSYFNGNHYNHDNPLWILLNCLIMALDHNWELLNSPLPIESLIENYHIIQ